MGKLRVFRRWLWLAVTIALAGLALLLVLQSRNSSAPRTQIAGVRFGGPFTLTGADGKPFSSAALAGKPNAIFFGFTNCPDVCPTTLSRMVRLRSELGKGERPFEIVFITVDPERDGPAQVGQYAGLFGSPVIGLTGSPADLARVKKLFGIYSAKVPDGSGGYGMDHTATVLLFDRQGRLAGTISPDESDPPALDKLRQLVG